MKFIMTNLFTILLLSSPVWAGQSSGNDLKLKEGIVQCCDSSGTFISDFNECLSFGLISIGDKRTEVIELFGSPPQMIGGIDTAQVGIYNLTPVKKGETPYLFVSISDDVVIMLQMQGYGVKEPLSFSGIALGDSAKLISSKFGTPDKIVRNEKFNSDLWKYESYPFSFEIENELVMSILVWRAHPKY